MANGRVCTGFSKPYVATYSYASGAIAYSNGQALARGVDVSITPESSGDNNFYADNQAAESSSGAFSGGTFSITVDGLKPAAEKLIMGLPTAGSDGWMVYDDDQATPHVGLGFIARYMEDGVASYVPYVLAKCAFDQIENSAATSEDSINFQTQSLSGSIFRADDAKHTWKWVGSSETSEAAAVAKLKTKLGITGGSAG